jgi:hypothetical protein
MKSEQFRTDYVRLHDRTDVEATKATRKYIDEAKARDEEKIAKRLAELKRGA